MSLIPVARLQEAFDLNTSEVRPLIEDVSIWIRREWLDFELELGSGEGGLLFDMTPDYFKAVARRKVKRSKVLGKDDFKRLYNALLNLYSSADHVRGVPFWETEQTLYNGVLDSWLSGTEPFNDGYDEDGEPYSDTDGRMAKFIENSLISLAVVNREDSVQWLYLNGLTMQKEVTGLTWKRYNAITEGLPEPAGDDAPDNNDRVEDLTISKKALCGQWADIIKIQVNSSHQLQAALQVEGDRKRHAALIYWLRGDSFSDAYKKANPADGERSGDMGSNGKRYARSAYTFLKERGVDLPFTIDDIGRR